MDAEIDWQLTNRELQIIDDLLHGWPNKQIAEHLGISDQTVKNQLSALYRKVGVSGRVELVVTAVKGGVTRYKY
jgi:DNA-binding NarL/FixJ family response regulator